MVRHILKPVLLLTMVMAMWACAADDDTTTLEVPVTNLAVPMAEYQYAGLVLVHTPGEELSNQHGLNKMFDVSACAEQHRQMTQTLTRQGIRVYELTDVLASVPLDSLRALASLMFGVDAGRMSRDDAIHYMLMNPTISASANGAYQVRYDQMPLKGIYYMRDQSISTPRGQVICRMEAEHRGEEPRLVEMCYRQLGCPPVYRLQNAGSYMEGGDYLPFGTLSFIGTGERTNMAAIQELMEADVIGHDTVVVVKDALYNMLQMHLDTYFNIIDAGLVALTESRLNAAEGSKSYLVADVYARAAGERQYRLMQADVSFVEFLRQRGITILPVSNSDEQTYACNFLCTGPRRIVAVAGQSETFAQQLAAHGVSVEWVSVDELLEGGGGIHCMTQVFKRVSP